MAEQELPADLRTAQKIPSMPPIASGEERDTMPSQSFASFMKGDNASPMAAAGKTPLISPFELAKGQSPLAQSPTIDSLLAQVTNAHSTINDLRENMSYPNLKLKASQKYLLKNKLTDANTNLRAANAKLGAQVPAEPEHTKFSGPLGKFLAFITDGQTQLQSAQRQLESLKEKGTNMTPGDFLLVQVKMSKASQELEYSSVLLSNAVQGFKTLMQVQL